MDKVQAEAIADALLEQARSKRPPKKSRARWSLRTLGERLLLAAFAIVGGCVGLGVFHFTARQAHVGTSFIGAELGICAGMLVGWAVITWRRVRGARKPAVPVHTD